MKPWNFPLIRAAVVAALGILIVILIGARKAAIEDTPAVALDVGPQVPQASSVWHSGSRMPGALDAENMFVIDPGGQPVHLRLALDEASRRDGNGKDYVVRLIPPATQDTLAARIAALPGTVFPVAYPDGGERSEMTRRIVTPDLRVRLDEAAADRIAATHGLTIKDRPAYAPGWVIMSAADSFDALRAMDGLRRTATVVSADVLMAVRRAVRALPNDPLIGDQWHLKNSNSTRTHMNVESAWSYGGSGGVKGSGIRIGIVDDGLQTGHPDLAANVDLVNDKDWNGNDSDPNPEAGDDHGTACAGNAAARGNNNLGVSGSAPEATLVGLRLIAGFVTDAQEAEAMAYRNDIIQIKSNSWGPNDTGVVLEEPGPLTRAALSNATATGRGGKGSIFLWAAGNGGDVGDGSNYDGYANSIHTIAIGATDSLGRRSYYSEPGSNLIVCAPSNGSGSALGITTVDRTGSSGYNTSSSGNGGDYTNDFGGTSSATPSASGVVALMLEKNPNLGWRDVQEILIRSAWQFRPTDSDWSTNAAGISFNHDFGAGLIDATAAVDLAAAWANLPAQTSSVSSQTGLSVSIPDNNATGITRTFDLAASNIRVEHVTVRLNINHTSRGNLEIELVSPGGMISRLAETHADTNNNYSNWTFSSVRHWGELSTGTWTLHIADRSTSGNATGGTLTSAEVTVFGSAAAPLNPPPVVQITSPANGQVFSPGASVNVAVTATDLTEMGDPGVVTQVELFDQGNSLGVDSSAPYEFTISPALGSHSLVAVATDSESAAGSSVSVAFSVVNQVPVITDAVISASGSFYSDQPLELESVTASDPEGAPLSYAYQWQSSVNGSTYVNETGADAAILNASPALAGKLWRCVITASDGETQSSPFITAAANALTRPVTVADAGSAYSYASGLVLRGTESDLSRAALINEFSQGSGTAEWVEILTLQEGSFRGWSFSDNSSGRLVFADSAVWDAVPAGTLIVIYSGASKDILLPADDSDPADGKMVLSSSDTTFFAGSPPEWMALGNSGDSVLLRDPSGAVVSQVSYGSSSAYPPNIGSVGSGASANFSGGSDAESTTPGQWTVTSSTVGRMRKPRAPGDLFFSEYIEGSGNNKVLEIFNPSGTAVDLAADGYQILIFANGAVSANNTIDLTGNVAGGGVFVIKNSSASSQIVAQQVSGILTFNGDDAVVLKKGAAIIDSIGQIGVDPGSSWSANGVSTVNHTLRRNSVVSQGDAIADDAFDPSAQWQQFDIDDFSGLGTHTMDDTPLEGVTPAAGNSPANTDFVTALRNGLLNHPALFRFGSTAEVPDGLTLDEASGVLSGTLSPANAAGDYQIVIERYNTLDEVVSQSFTLTLNAAPTLTHDLWIAGFAVGALDGVADDPDHDGLANAIENILGSRPDEANSGLSGVSATPGQLIFEHDRSKVPASDLTAEYEWSADCESWHPSGGEAAGTTVTMVDSVLVAAEAPANERVRVTATASGVVPARIFVRLRVRRL